MKAVADTLGVARSNLVEHLRRADRPRRGPYVRAGDDEIIAEIRTIIDARPTYGYRRVTALLNRARRGSGKPTLNHKRVFRLMRMASLLLQPCTGRRVIRAHEGVIIAPASNQRWASDGFEISCWNGEIVRIAFAIDTHDREIMAWVATSGGGISGEMIRDLMLDCVESRFDALRAPHQVQWLADNGSPYTAAEALRLLVDSILVFPGERRGEVAISLGGDLAFFLEADAVRSLNGKKPADLTACGLGARVLARLDAGTGFEPVTFRL